MRWPEKKAYFIKETQQMPMCSTLKKSKRNSTYQKEQIEYIKVLINKIKNSVKDRQPWLVWQIANELSGKDSILRAKLEAASLEEKLLKWKEHLKNLLENPPETTDKPTKKLIAN